MSTIHDPLQWAFASTAVAAAGQASAAAIARWQQERLVRMLGVARQGSALYRERLAGLPDAPDSLARIAPVARAELMGRFDAWVCDPQLRLEELRAFTAEPRLAGSPFLERYLVWESSGTSGSPGIFVQDARALAVYDALEALRRHPGQAVRRWFDPFFLSDRIAFVGATQGHFASCLTIERLRQLQPWLASTVRTFSILQPVPDLVAQLNAFAPTILATYPTAADMLAEEARRGRFGSGTLREVWTGGETLSAAARERIGDALACPVRNSYGTSEFLAMGWECAAGRMHLNTDWLVLEPVDERHRPVPPGEPCHSVLLTSLANDVQPLIRYDLGDQVVVQAEPCACGSGLPVIEVQGRRDDTLVVPGRHGTAVPLLPLALSTVLEEQAGVFDFQIRQRDERTLVLRLPETGAEGRKAMARCRAALGHFVEKQGALPVRVVAELGQAVPLGRSGKARRILAHA